MSIVSCYFFAGDFSDVIRRHQSGEQQIYQTHNEVARLVNVLLGQKHQINLYSFVTADRRVDSPLEGLRICSMGAANYSATGLLSSAVESDNADTIVAHFPNFELLRAVSRSKARAIAVLANSYNKTGLGPQVERFRISRLLNRDRFELVSNHCLPATEHLAKIGVKRSKLIPWDVLHPFEPKQFEPKTLPIGARSQIVYAGSIVDAKGVSDLIMAIALLRDEGLDVQCTFAGAGDIDRMKALASRLSVSELTTFLGLVGNEQIFSLMRNADLVAVPSRTHYTEGFPLVMFEALASRTPIVCSDHPMFRSVMIEGKSASVFPAGNHQALAKAIQRTLSDPTQYAALSQAAVSTWEALKGPADWRTMLTTWINEGVSSPWLRQHMLTNKISTI